MNALVIGVEIDQARHGEVSWYVKYAELMFLTIFIFELVIRITAYGMASFGRPFLVFDFFLILFGAISFIGEQLSPASSWAKALGNLTVGRMLRLIRLTYGLRKVEWGVDLYKLATGLFSSFRTIISAFVLIAAAMYLFACVGVEVCNVQKLMDNPDTASIVETNFGSVPKALLTFTQFVSSDSIAAIYNPLIQSEPWLAFYFIPGMLVIGIALMNLVTALIVQTAIDAAANDTEALREEKQRMIESLLPDIGEAFRRMDTSGDGTLGADELESDAILARLPEKLQEVIPTSKLTDMLETLGDTLPGGEIDEMEFTWAIVTVALGEMENKQHLCYLRRLNKDLKLLR
jgi:voltage-gated sodium channel